MEKSQQFKEMSDYTQSLQDKICSEITLLDKKKIYEDRWRHHEAGGGLSRIIENGNIFEKAGVNWSAVCGKLPKEIASYFNKEPMGFAACGISLVLHPFSPRIPTIHMNVRYFEMEDQDSWFGGGIDMTPYYPHKEDFVHFHKTLQNSVDNIMPNHYLKYKKECDDYFTIKHRNEMRGIGGIFFDYLKDKPNDHFNLIKSVGDHFLPSYLPIIAKRKQESFTNDEKDFQLIRRGRYVEFNLMYDRGTLFGLKTNGRIESIFMSLPMHVSYPYNYQPPQDTPQQTMSQYYQPNDWVHFGSLSL